MRALRDFSEFVKTGIVRKRRPDPARSKSLVSEADKRRTFLKELREKIPISDENANYFVEGAHEAEVSYMRELGFSEKDTRFMNDLRYFRNSIKYYGRQFDQEYAEKVFNFMERLYPQLKKAIE
jgi:5'-deoxynucleotidase YfbR-like HD superfamily hydrolase